MAKIFYKIVARFLIILIFSNSRSFIAMKATQRRRIEIKSPTVVNDLGRSKKAAHALTSRSPFREDSFDREKRVVVGIVSKGVSTVVWEVNFCTDIYHRSRVTFPKRGANRAPGVPR